MIMTIAPPNYSAELQQQIEQHRAAGQELHDRGMANVGLDELVDYARESKQLEQAADEENRQLLIQHLAHMSFADLYRLLAVQTLLGETAALDIELIDELTARADI
jgi:hypothetical protein